MPHSLYIEFNYSIQDASATVIDTNIKTSYINDFLAEVVHAQIGAGKDNRKANERDIYNVLIRYDLSYDPINIRSNTGNNSLTTGIIGYSIDNWHFSDSILEQMSKSDNFIGSPKPKNL